MTGSGNSLFVDANGNVGIGTTVPLAKLDVNGSIFSPQFSVIQLANNLPATSATGGIPWLINTQYTIYGGSVLIFANFSGYTVSVTTRTFTLQYSTDNGVSYTTIGSRSLFFNNTSFHLSTSATFLWQPGNITITNWRVSYTGTINNEDFLHLVVLQLPF